MEDSVEAEIEAEVKRLAKRAKTQRELQEETRQKWWKLTNYGRLDPNITPVWPDDGVKGLADKRSDERYEQAKATVAAWRREDRAKELKAIRRDVEALKAEVANYFERLKEATRATVRTPSKASKQFSLIGQPMPATLTASMEIGGTVMTAGPNKNHWGVRREDLPHVAVSLVGKTLRLMHSNSPREVVGRVHHAWVEDDKIKFQARLVDEEIERKIEAGLLDSVSIQVIPKKFVCSECGAVTRGSDGVVIHDFREHGEGAYEIAESPEALELSIVCSPAYDSARFRSVDVAG